MPATPADLFAFLGRLGIATDTVAHEALFTVAQSRALRGQIAGGHTKNLFLKDRKGRLYLVVAPEEAQIDLKRLHQRVAAAGRLSFGNPDLLAAALGVAPGSVTPFAAMNDARGAVTLVLDRALLDEERLNFHPLANTLTTAIAWRDLLIFLRATGHEPMILDLGGERGEPRDDCQRTTAAPFSR